jgi:hypothetical protein
MFRQFTRARIASATLIGGLVLSAIAVGTASAAPPGPISATACQKASGKVAARAVAINQGDTITLQATPPDGKYIGQASAEVFCQGGAAQNYANLGDITDAQIKVTISPDLTGVPSPKFTVEGVGVAGSGNPATLGPFTGTVTFNVIGATDLLPPGVASAKVGVNIEVVSAAWGGALTDPTTGTTLKPGTFGDVLAQTPELDSLVLFASGAAGLIGYATLRRRARGKPRA